MPPIPGFVGTPGFHSAWFDETDFPTIAPLDKAIVMVRFRNTGTVTWRRGVVGTQVTLGVNGDETGLADLGMTIGWLWANRATTTLEDAVALGAVDTFRFVVRAPAQPGTYRIPLRLVADGVTWLDDEGVYVDVHGDFRLPQPVALRVGISDSARRRDQRADQHRLP